MELGEPDERGRRRPVPKAGSEFELPVDTVIVAIGNSPNPLIKKTTPDLPVNERGGITTDERGKTGKLHVYGILSGSGINNRADEAETGTRL